MSQKWPQQISLRSFEEIFALTTDLESRTINKILRRGARQMSAEFIFVLKSERCLLKAFFTKQNWIAWVRVSAIIDWITEAFLIYFLFYLKGFNVKGIAIFRISKTSLKIKMDHVPRSFSRGKCSQGRIHIPSDWIPIWFHFRSNFQRLRNN